MMLFFPYLVQILCFVYISESCFTVIKENQSSKKSHLASSEVMSTGRSVRKGDSTGQAHCAYILPFAVVMARVIQSTLSSAAIQALTTLTTHM